ncbi:MAG: type I secretion system permease/ATPase [Nitrospinae bacterium]|nr:type I secretion system permease/ATPase [Nitrospinota bacterium]
MISKNNIDTGCTCLALLARFHHVAADPSALRHELGKNGGPFSDTDILRAASYLKLKAKAIKAAPKTLASVALPAIAKHKDGRYFILAQYHAEKDEFLIQDPLANRPQILDREQFQQAWTGELILVAKRSLLPGMTGKFGFSWFIPSILKYKKLLGEVLAASFFIQLFALVTPLFFQVVIDKVLVHRGLSTLDVLAAGLLAISLFDVVLNGLRTFLFSHTTNRIDVVLGSSLFKHLVNLPIAYFQNRQVGTTVARVRELETIRNFITGSALTLVIDVFFTFVFFAVMYYYSPVLLLVTLGSIPPYIAISAFITPILKKRLDEKFKRGAENQAFLVEAVSGMETLKAMAVEPQMQVKWEEQLAGYVLASFRSQNLGNVAGQVAQFINKITTVLILWFGARLVIDGGLSVGQLIAFNMLAGRVSGPILRLAQLWQDFQQARISMERLGDILDTPAEPGHNPNRTTLPRIRGHVQFEHVGFRYHPGQPQILHDIHFSVNPGEVIGIVGRSGSGKSTLTKLVQRLYVPESGRVLIDGVDLSLVQPAWLRRQVGVVLQENFMFNRSVKENIALADPAMPAEHVIHVAKLVGAHEFILDLPEGYDTKIEEQGRNLSGGQKQRIAIARALLTDPRILILDEATSALDYESERIIQDRMREICRNRTVFIIAHRLSAVRQANRIIVIDKGRIAEHGNHESLIKQRGLYARLHLHQAGMRVVA